MISIQIFYILAHFLQQNIHQFLLRKFFNDLSLSKKDPIAIP
jgi:hypothetical protein